MTTLVVEATGRGEGSVVGVVSRADSSSGAASTTAKGSKSRLALEHETNTRQRRAVAGTL
jgi:hypothetical protein